MMLAFTEAAGCCNQVKGAETMARYLVLWELAVDRIPVDPKERGAAFSLLQDMVEADQKKGLLTDWGAFVAETRGYAVGEGTEVEMGLMAQQYAPYVLFTTHPVATLSQAQEVSRTVQQ